MEADAMGKTMKILIGYDGSDCAESAIDDLTRAGLPPEAEARILTVAEIWLPPPPPSSFEIVEQAREVKVPADIKRVYSKESATLKQAKHLADRAADRLRAKFPKWDVTALASSGSAAWELVLQSDQWNPDLIVVGSHGRSALGRLV